MKVSVTLIRGGLTLNGWDNPFLGLLDVELAEEEKTRIAAKVAEGEYPPAQIVYSSTMIRCRETARIIYPKLPAIIIKELAPYDYGNFTGKSQEWLQREETFRGWVNARDLQAVPGGEDPYGFSARSCLAFRSIVAEMANKQIESAAVFTHKQVIKAILQRYCIPRHYYGDWSVSCGGGYTLEYDSKTMTARVKRRF